MTDASSTPLLDRPRTRIPQRTSRRRRLAIVALLTVGLIATAAGAAVTLRDASVPVGGDVGLVSDGTRSLSVEYADAPSVELVSYEHGAEISYALELRNDGPLPITVEDVPIAAAADDLRLIRPTGVLVAPAGVNVADATEGARPFEPFVLGRGETRSVIVEGVFDNCVYYTERAMDVFESQPVTWSVAGWSTTTDVELSRQLAVRSPYMRICPGRVMDRGARTRVGTATL